MARFLIHLYNFYLIFNRFSTKREEKQKKSKKKRKLLMIYQNIDITLQRF